MEQLGDILLRTANVPMDAIEAAAARCAQGGGRIGSRLILMGYCTSDQVARALGEQHSAVPAGEQAFQLVSSKALRAVPKDWCKRHGLCPLAIEGDTLHVAMRDPGDLRMVDELARALNYLLRPYATPELTLYNHLERLMGIPRPSPYGMRRSTRRSAENVNVAVIIDESADQQIDDVDVVDLNVDDLEVDSPEENELVEVVEPLGATSQPHGAPTGPAYQAISTPRPKQPAKPRAQETQSDDLELVFLDEVSRAGFFDEGLDEIEIDIDITGDDNTLDSSSTFGLEEVVALLELAGDRETVVTALLQPVLAGASLGLLLMPKEDFAVGMAACGSEAPPSQVRQLMLPLSVPSSIARAIETKRVVRAPTAGDPLQNMIATYLRAPDPQEVCVAPVTIRDKVVNLVCVQTDRKFEGNPAAILERITQTAAEAYRRLILQRRRETK